MEGQLGTVWERVAVAVPVAPALVQGTRVVCWREFDDDAGRLAAALRAAGVGTGETVAIDLYNCPEFLEAAFAIFKLGATFANVNHRYTAEELGYLLDDADAVALVYHRSLRHRVLDAATRLPRLRVLVEVDDVGDGTAPPPGVHDWESFLGQATPVAHADRPLTDLFMFYTGGTTGLPKGVLRPATTDVLRVVAPEATYDTRTALLGLTAPYDDVANPPPVTLVACPLMHGVGFTWTSLPSLCVGGTVVLLESRSFDPDELLDVAAANRATFVSVVGDAFVRPLLRALDARRAAGTLPDLSSIERVCSAGVAWHGDAKTELLDYLPGATLIEGCGSDGGNYGISYTRRGEVPRTSSFTRVPGTLVLRDDGSQAPVGEIGRLAAISHSPGYHKDPERTARVQRTINGIRYVVPGDYGRIEPDGTLTLIGRGTSTINTGGEKVHPEEVEAVLATHPAVEDCMVFGMPDDRLGETVTAIVQLRGAACEAELVDHAKTHLADYKSPRRIVVATVPRFANGKPDFASARALVEDARR